MAGKWRDTGGTNCSARNECRLKELALALVIPWGDSWPQFWAGEVYSAEWHARMAEVERACKDEKLPWEL